MNKEVKAKKILHKVKKNWVVIGMTSVALLGTGFVVSQTSNVLPTGIVAHADESTQASAAPSSASTTSSAADNNNSSSALQSNGSSQSSSASQTTNNNSDKSGDYTAPQSAVSATISNLGSQTTNIKKNSSINYAIALNNNDNLGRVIPKGTQIKINVNTPEQTSLKGVFSYSVYSKYSSQNNFDDSISGNTITLTTKKDFYPGTVNMNLSLVVDGPKYNWNGDTEEHETNPDPVNVNITSSLQLPGESDQNVTVEGGQLSIIPNTKKEDDDVIYNSAETPGYVQPYLSKDYPDDVADYPKSNTKSNYVTTDNNNVAHYAPAYTNAEGKPYFVATGEFNKGNISGYSGARISFTDGNSFDLKNLKLYASKDGKTFEDVSDKPGVSFGVDGNGAVYADFSKSAYNKDFVDFVAYRPYTDLSSKYFIRGYGSYYKEGTSEELSLPIGDLNYQIVPVTDDYGSSWVVAPNQTAYTQPDGTYVYKAENLKDGVNVYKTVDGQPAGYEKLDNATVDITNDGNVSEGGTIKVAQQSSQQLHLTYTSADSHSAQATLTVINPYVSVPDQKVTRTATVNYVDSITGKVLKTDTGSSVFKATGVKDTRDNLITWGNWSNVSGDGTYNFTVPTIDGYVPEDSSNVSGTLAPLGNDVTRTVLMDPTEQVTSTNTVPVIAIPRDKTKTITTTGKVGTSTESAPIDGYQETKNVTFTRTGTKNQKTGNVTWGNFTPDSQTVSFTAPNIPGYYLISKSQKDHKVSAPLSDGPRVIYLSFLYKPMSDVTRTTKGNVTINYIDEETKQAIHDPYSKDLEFTQAGKKNDQTGETVWDDKGYTPASQSYSVDSPKIDGYELVNPSQSTVSGTISGGDDGIVDTVAYKKIETPSSSASDISAASSEASQSSSAASSSADSSSAESSASSHVVVPNSSTPSHGNNNGKPAADKHEASTPTVENHKNNGGTLSVENKATNTSANKEANRLLQTGDQTHENILVAIGAALIAMALGLVFFGSRRRRK
ncbi:MAG: MucBP domain-containing protein [Apilactobacillus sp.]|uniref:mucin-binding protein n=1 Tax=Apilactobacillus nanyangensis TaxID=2799579 RepID=UPI001942DDBF|nr:LPXTG cell wall anchor domain-containing protein [Apilactobacillus nanyangensis]MCT6859123.1 MucBP domain-containing protein [Apilactobacillus sp.]